MADRQLRDPYTAPSEGGFTTPGDLDREALANFAGIDRQAPFLTRLSQAWNTWRNHDAALRRAAITHGMSHAPQMFSLYGMRGGPGAVAYEPPPRESTNVEDRRGESRWDRNFRGTPIHPSVFWPSPQSGAELVPLPRRDGGSTPLAALDSLLYRAPYDDGGAVGKRGIPDRQAPPPMWSLYGVPRTHPDDSPHHIPASLIGDIPYRYQGVGLHGGLAGAASIAAIRNARPGLAGFMSGWWPIAILNGLYAYDSINSGRTAPRSQAEPGTSTLTGREAGTPPPDVGLIPREEAFGQHSVLGIPQRRNGGITPLAALDSLLYRAPYDDGGAVGKRGAPEIPITENVDGVLTAPWAIDQALGLGAGMVRGPFNINTSIANWMFPNSEAVRWGTHLINEADRRAPIASSMGAAIPTVQAGLGYAVARNAIRYPWFRAAPGAWARDSLKLTPPAMGLFGAGRNIYETIMAGPEAIRGHGDARSGGVGTVPYRDGGRAPYDDGGEVEPATLGGDTVPLPNIIPQTIQPRVGQHNFIHHLLSALGRPSVEAFGALQRGEGTADDVALTLPLPFGGRSPIAPPARPMPRSQGPVNRDNVRPGWTAEQEYGLSRNLLGTGTGPGFRYQIYNRGNHIGGAGGEVLGDTAHINYITTYGAGPLGSTPNSLGVSGIRALREAMRSDFPDVVNFIGARSSGSRRGPAARPGTNVEQNVTLYAKGGRVGRDEGGEVPPANPSPGLAALDDIIYAPPQLPELEPASSPAGKGSVQRTLPALGQHNLFSRALQALIPSGDVERERAELDQTAQARGQPLTLSPTRGEIDQAVGLFMSPAIFAGTNAATANLAAQARAVALERQGVPRDTIWRETGWGRGNDGRWRFEIDDSGSRISNEAWAVAAPRAQSRVPPIDPELAPILPRTTSEGIPWPSAFIHEDLYAAYPQLRRGNLMLREKPEIDGYTDTRSSGVHAPDIQQARSTTLHERTHDTQHQAGFFGGQGSLGDILANDPGIRAHRLDPIVTNTDEFLPWWRRLLIGRTNIDRAAEDAQRAAWWARRDELARQAHRRAASEVEARNVETRRDMTAAQRRQTPPWHTQDVPDAEQIVPSRGYLHEGPRPEGIDLSFARPPLSAPPRGEPPATKGSLTTRLDEVPTPPRRMILPSDLPIQSDGANLVVRSPIGNGIVEGRVTQDGRTLMILGSRIFDPGSRGHGIGLAMYQRLIDEAHRRGLVVTSDTTVSDSARRIYDALAARGYVVERNPSAATWDGALGGMHVPGYEAPVFTVRPPPPLEGPPVGGRGEPPATKGPQASMSVPRGNEDLAYLLGPRSQVGVIGPETGTVSRNGVSALQLANAPEGYQAVRFVYTRDGQIVGAMQVTRTPNGPATVANTYVAPEFRRAGIATELNQAATNMFGQLARSDGPSEAGAAFRSSLGAPPATKGGERTPPRAPEHPDVAGYRSEGTLGANDAVTEAIMPRSSFNGRDIRASQVTVDSRGARHWLQQIRNGARPAILLEETAPGQYRIVDGHTRATAYAQAGVDDIPVIIRRRPQRASGGRVVPGNALAALDEMLYAVPTSAANSR